MLIMHHTSKSLVLWFSVVVYASPSESPCATVSELVASHLSKSTDSSGAEAAPTVPAKIAYDCLNTFPLNTTSALEYLDLAEPYIQWQTNLDYVKSPPAEYAEMVQDPYDFWAHWNELRDNVISGYFENQYAFDHAVFKTIHNVHDSHFKLVPLSVGGVFNFARRLPLVSVAIDGLPEVYAYKDILDWKTNGSQSNISPVTRISGEEVNDFLLNWSRAGSGVHDPDALWNALFYSPAQFSLSDADATADHAGLGSFIGGDDARWQYPGAETSFEFGNGTTLTVENYAVILRPALFNGTEDGTQLYEKCCKPIRSLSLNIWESLSAEPEPPSENGSLRQRKERQSKHARAPKSLQGYPLPVVETDDGVVSGYFLDEPGMTDVAVLAVRTFQPSDSETFKSVVSDFLQKSKQAAKKKLIIDLSANSGGVVTLGSSLFKALFPTMTPYTPQRYRAHEGLDLLGQQVGEMLDSGTFDRDNDDAFILENSALNYQGFEVDAANLQNFSSWSDFYGPHEADLGDSLYTSHSQFNLTFQDASWDNFSDTQPFNNADIAVVTDGFCGSTCSIFAYLMRHQANTTFISLGGRSNWNISQAVGGVKGTNYLDLYGLFEYGKAVVTLSNQSSTLIEKWETTVLANYTALPGTVSGQARVNSKDALMVNDESGTPLHFIYEPADCRIFYTPDMVLEQSRVWEAVADTVWLGKSSCI